jgi:hypothetical protein
MSITLQFNVQEGDTFHYQSTFTLQRGGQASTNASQSTERVVKVEADAVHLMDPNEAEPLVTVRDRRGRPVDFLQDGVSIKDELPEDVWDISNALIFPPGPVEPGDTGEVDDGVVRLTYRLVGTGTARGREVAEVHATAPGYSGPIRFWVELATGMLMRREYTVGGAGNTTTTVLERI